MPLIRGRKNGPPAQSHSAHGRRERPCNSLFGTDCKEQAWPAHLDSISSFDHAKSNTGRATNVALSARWKARGGGHTNDEEGRKLYLLGEREILRRKMERREEGEKRSNCLGEGTPIGTPPSRQARRYVLSSSHNALTQPSFDLSLSLSF